MSEVEASRSDPIPEENAETHESEKIKREVLDEKKKEEDGFDERFFHITRAHTNRPSIGEIVDQLDVAMVYFLMDLRTVKAQPRGTGK
jgi:hypothetical protein